MMERRKGAPKGVIIIALASAIGSGAASYFAWNQQQSDSEAIRNFANTQCVASRASTAVDTIAWHERALEADGFMQYYSNRHLWELATRWKSIADSSITTHQHLLKVISKLKCTEPEK